MATALAGQGQPCPGHAFPVYASREVPCQQSADLKEHLRAPLLVLQTMQQTLAISASTAVINT